MNNLLRLSTATASLALLLTAARAADPEPGFVDVGQFLPAAKGQFVEVNLSPGLLKFASKLAVREDPEVAQLVGNLKRIRVNVVSMDDSNRGATIEKINTFRQSLEAQGWTKIVTVREKNDGDNVDVQVKQRTEDTIDGIVVTVINHEGEAVVVNIVGNITAEQIGKVADKFDIEPLKKIHLKSSHPQTPADKVPVAAPEKQV